MAISTNYGILQNQIADELGDRQDLLKPLSDSTLSLSPIQNAIQSAIAKWERQPFYFNDSAQFSLFNTVIGQFLYLPSFGIPQLIQFANIARLHLTVAGSTYALVPRRWTYLEDISIGNQNGKPTDYAYFAEALRLYPPPDGAYPVSLSGTQRFNPLVVSTDLNPWTEDAYDLIRSEAKLILAREVIFDDDLAARMTLAIYGDPANPRQKGYLVSLQEETARRGRVDFPPVMVGALRPARSQDGMTQS